MLYIVSYPVAHFSEQRVQCGIRTHRIKTSFLGLKTTSQTFKTLEDATAFITKSVESGRDVPTLTSDNMRKERYEIKSRRALDISEFTISLKQ